MKALTSIAIIIYLVSLVACSQQPEPAPGPTPTIPILKWEGSGDQVVSFNARGYNAIRFGSGHRGKQNFIVHVLDESGTLIGGAANCIADCEEDNIVQIFGDGLYYLEVSADGNWFIVAMPLK